MSAENLTPRPRSRAKPVLDQELIDDQRFQQKLEAKRFRDRIEREANEVLVCLGCGRSTRRIVSTFNPTL
jgi:hypothetical protein